MASSLDLEHINRDVLVQVLSFGFIMTVSVSVSTCAGVGAAVVVVICVEVLHAIMPVIDDSFTGIFTALLVQEVVISPVNAIILRQYTCWPLVIVAGALWMGAEACGYEVMARTDVALLKRFLGLCLVLVLVLNHGVPLLRRACSRMLGTKPHSNDPASEKRKFRGIPVSLGKSQAAEIDDPVLNKEDATSGREDAEENCEELELDDLCLSEAEPGAASASEHVQLSEFGLRTRREWLLAIFLGLAGGFLRGVCGAPILALVSFVLLSQIPKDQWRGTNPALTVVGLPMRLYYFLVVKERFDFTRWPQICGALLGCLVGIFVGHSLSSKFNQADFLDFINFVVVVGAVLLLTNGLPASIPLAMSTALCWLVVYAIVRFRQRVRG
mmetsp:Transcript_23747/g.52389  ORF Transcript_23747/g.52389 Transcript_23747/m.52389 type:complete len:384 (-) Transcript_23747:90-1241(-)